MSEPLDDWQQLTLHIGSKYDISTYIYDKNLGKYIIQSYIWSYGISFQKLQFQIHQTWAIF